MTLRKSQLYNQLVSWRILYVRKGRDHSISKINQCLYSMLLLRAMLVSMALLQLRAMLVSVVHVATKGHWNVCGLCCHLNPCRCPWPILWPEAMLMSVVCAPIRGSVVGHGPCYHWRALLMSVPMLLNEATLVSMGWAPTNGDVYNLCCSQGPS